MEIKEIVEPLSPLPSDKNVWEDSRGNGSLYTSLISPTLGLGSLLLLS